MLLRSNQKEYEKYLDSKYIKLKNSCKICGNPTNNKLYCSYACTHLGRRKVKWPEKEEIKLLLEKNSMGSISKIYNVSTNTVWKWIKYYKI